MAIEITTRTSAKSPERTTPVAPAADATRAAGGNSLPPDGKAPPREPVPADISRAVSNLNRFLEESQRGFVFQLDASSGRTIITIVNPNTGEIVRQIPPEEVLNAARTLRDAGILLNARA